MLAIRDLLLQLLSQPKQLLLNKRRFCNPRILRQLAPDQFPTFLSSIDPQLVQFIIQLLTKLLIWISLHRQLITKFIKLAIPWLWYKKWDQGMESRKFWAYFRTTLVGKLLVFSNIVRKRYSAYCLSKGRTMKSIKRFKVYGSTPIASKAY